MTKGSAFIMCFVAICAVLIGGIAIAFYEVIFVPEHMNDASVLSLVPVGQCLTALVSLTTLFIGGSVANNGVKGAFYRKELDTNSEPDDSPGTFTTMEIKK